MSSTNSAQVVFICILGLKTALSLVQKHSGGIETEQLANKETLTRRKDVYR
jgi:predicted ThiF/HesA family dinucleotide-utilizing enzyme